MTNGQRRTCKNTESDRTTGLKDNEKERITLSIVQLGKTVMADKMRLLERTQ